MPLTWALTSLVIMNILKWWWLKIQQVSKFLYRRQIRIPRELASSSIASFIETLTWWLQTWWEFKHTVTFFTTATFCYPVLLYVVLGGASITPSPAPFPIVFIHSLLYVRNPKRKGLFLKPLWHSFLYSGHARVTPRELVYRLVTIVKSLVFSFL